MLELQIITCKIDMGELPEIQRLTGLKTYASSVQLQELETLNIQMPTLLLIRMEDEETASVAKQEWNQERMERVWSFLNSIDRGWSNLAVMLFVQNRSFDLLYRAIECKVDAVVLEPASKKEISEKLDACVHSILQRDQILEDRKRLEEHEFATRQRMMERLVEQILATPNEVDFMLPEINNRYNLSLGDKNYQAVVVSVNQFDLYTKDSKFSKEMTRAILHNLTGAREILIHRKDPYGIIVLINYPDRFSVRKSKEDLENLRLAIEQFKIRYHFEAAIGVGEVVKSLKDIHKSLVQAAYVQEYRMKYPDRVYYSSELLKDNIEITNFLTEQSMRELCRYVFMGDTERIRAWYGYFYSEIEPKFEKYPPAYAKYCWKMYCYIKDMAESKKVPMFPDVKFFALQYRFGGHERMLETEKLLLEITHLIQSEIPSDKKIAQEAMAYMKVHFSEAINLECIAEACGVSTSYFSRKFKEQTGENYIDVLTEIRMKEAQRLLIETDCGIDEILEKLCYSDDKHFRSLFVNYTGMLPMAYRKANRKATQKVKHK